MDFSMPDSPISPSPHLRVCSNSCPLRQWCHPTISSSFVPSPPWWLVVRYRYMKQLFPVRCGKSAGGLWERGSHFSNETQRRDGSFSTSKQSLWSTWDWCRYFGTIKGARLRTKWTLWEWLILFGTRGWFCRRQFSHTLELGVGMVSVLPEPHLLLCDSVPNRPWTSAIRDAWCKAPGSLVMPFGYPIKYGVAYLIC